MFWMTYMVGEPFTSGFTLKHESTQLLQKDEMSKELVRQIFFLF